MTPQGIVVHNTAGASSAEKEITDMINSEKWTSFHVAIDEATVVESIPFNRSAWHGGDGGSGYANRNLLGFEICRSMDFDSDAFIKAEENAVEYIAYVCIQFGWDSSYLHQHNWYASTDCPHRTKDHWERFKSLVDAKIAELSDPQPQLIKAETADKEFLKLSLHGYERDIDGKIIDGRAYVAVRQLLEQMGYAVGYDNGVIAVEYRK